MARLTLIPREEFERARHSEDIGLIADMCRANALVAVKRAGSGHLGSSFSALDLVVHLLWRELNVAEVGWEHPDRDVFFSSKGHDVPGLYAALHALGLRPTRPSRIPTSQGIDRRTAGSGRHGERRGAGSALAVIAIPAARRPGRRAPAAASAAGGAASPGSRG